MRLRPYQREAVEAVYRHLREREDNPCVVIPTGGGKSLLLATICADAVKRWDGRVIVLAHVKELLEQTAEHIRTVAPALDVGIYSAGLRSRDTDHSVIVAGIQSVYKRACELGSFDLALVDESHLIPPEGDGMFRQFLADAHVINPYVRTVGFTATPYRMKSGTICKPDHFLNTVCYEIGVKELIRDGYLCPLKTKAGVARADMSGLHVRGGEYIATEVEDLMDEEELVRAACGELVEQTQGRRSILIFASGIKHGRHVQSILQEEHGVECGFVCGRTPTNEREALLARFRREQQAGLFGDDGPLRYLCNVNVLTTGFDAPNIDCVAMLRPTLSAGLFYQMAGRGFRLHPDKDDCLILDFAGNILRHGPVDQIRIREPDAKGSGEAPAKECPDCHEVVLAGYAVCPVCGYEFPPPERTKHEATASTESVLSGETTVIDYEVQGVVYTAHRKRGAPLDHPRTMRVEYQVGLGSYISEWICIEHSGWPRQKAESWWRERSHETCPTSADEAVAAGQSGALAETLAIKVKHTSGDEFDRVIGYTLGPRPRLPGWDEELEEDAEPVSSWIDEEDVPF
ncbi:MAG: DEAD/DEAH box helicase [Planctomycetota bacterium]